MRLKSFESVDDFCCLQEVQGQYNTCNRVSYYYAKGMGLMFDGGIFVTPIWQH